MPLTRSSGPRVGSGSGGVLPGTTKIPSSDEIVVGISGNGDTLSTCHILDTGNGAGLTAAFAQASANSSKQYVIRSKGGTITLTAMLVIPSNVTWFGYETTIVGPTGAGGAAQDIVDASAGGCVVHGVTFSCPAAASGSIAGNGIVYAGNNTTWVDCLLLVAGGANTMQTPFGFSTYESAPSGIRFSRCGVRITSAGAGLTAFSGFDIEDSDSYAEPTKRLEYIDCYVEGIDGVATSAFVTIPKALIRNARVKDCPIAVSITIPDASSTTMTGPRVQGVDIDNSGLTAQANTLITVDGSSSTTGKTIVDTMVKDISYIGGATAAPVLVRVLSSGTHGTSFRNLRIANIQAQNVTAGSGAISISVAQEATLNGLAINDCTLQNGDVLMSVANTATITSTTITGTRCRNMTLATAQTNTMIAACEVTGTLTIPSGASVVWAQSNLFAATSNSGSGTHLPS